MQRAFLVSPALDHLHAVQVGAIGILDGADQETGRLGRFGTGQVATHGHTLAIAEGGEVGPGRVRFGVVPAAEEAQHDARPGGRIDLATLECREQGLAGIGFGPHGGVAGSGMARLG